MLRAEKGYIVVGQETDGTVIPADLGLDWAIGKSKADFVGKRSLMRPDMLRTDRKQLVGLLASDMLEEGAQIVADANSAVPMAMLGHITSAYWSEALGRPIALGLVAGGRARIGQTLYVPMPDSYHRRACNGSDLLRFERQAAAWLSALILWPRWRPRRPIAMPCDWPRCRRATRLIIRGGATAIASIGMELPATCRAVKFGERALLWLGPEEFLLLAPDDLMPAIDTAFVVDISHRNTALSVSGPRADWAINAFCALDLHPSAFAVGMCTRTVLGKAEIVLWRTAAETFHIEVARSFAPYVWNCLDEARREFFA